MKCIDTSVIRSMTKWGIPMEAESDITTYIMQENRRKCAYIEDELSKLKKDYELLVKKVEEIDIRLMDKCGNDIDNYLNEYRLKDK